MSSFNLQTVPAGAVFIYNPFATIQWCYRHRVWPHFITWFTVLLGCFLFLVTWDPYGHVVQYVGGGWFIHTSLGKVRKESQSDFPPGYLETCVIVVPKNKTAFEEYVQCSFEARVDKPNRDPTTILLTPLFRLLYACGLISKTFRSKYKYTNCTEFIAREWKAGYRSICPDSLCYPGIYPGDFLKHLPVFERFTKSQ